MHFETPWGAEASRTALAQQQTQLLAALVAGAEPPEGLDRQRLHIQARALLTKRSRAVATHSPGLAAALGDTLPELFAAYAAGNPRPPGGGHADAAAFATYLRSKNKLPSGTVPLRSQVSVLLRLFRLIRRLRPRLPGRN